MASKKDVAVSFLNLVAAGRVRDAYAKHIGADFHHHNPFFADGAEPLMAAMEENARKFPQKQLRIVRALEDGDLVATHSQVRQHPDDRGAAVVHLFRFEGDRIAELWDVGQPVPDQPVNAASMF